VERTFSFGRDLISNKRHCIADTTLCKTLTVGLYSKKGLIKPGVLFRGKKADALEAKANKGKSKRLRLILPGRLPTQRQASEVEESEDDDDRFISP
jgi:hypothetical protein